MTTTIDPPPDLAIEIDMTRRSVARQPIYADLAIPELWRFDGKNISVLELTQAKSYRPRDASIAIPFLTRIDLQRFLDQAHEMTDMQFMRSFQKWARTLKS